MSNSDTLRQALARQQLEFNTNLHGGYVELLKMVEDLKQRMSFDDSVRNNKT